MASFAILKQIPSGSNHSSNFKLEEKIKKLLPIGISSHIEILKICKSAFESIFEEEQEKLLKGDFSEEEYLKKLENYLNNLGAKTKEEVLKEIKTDIQLLKDILKDVVLKAIALEIPFKSAITHYVDRIERAVKDGNEFGKNFLAKIGQKLLYKEFAKIERTKKEQETIKEILTEMRGILEQLHYS